MTHLLHEPVLNVHQNLPRLSIPLDEHVQGIAVRHPSDQTRSRGKRRDRVLLHTEVTLGAFLIGCEECVDQSEELHNSLILSEILVA